MEIDMVTLLGGGLVGFLAAFVVYCLLLSPLFVGSLNDRMAKKLEDEGTAIASRINTSLDKYEDLSKAIDTIEERIRAIAGKADKIGLRFDQVFALRQEVDKVFKENLNLMSKLRTARKKEVKQTLLQEVKLEDEH